MSEVWLPSGFLLLSESYPAPQPVWIPSLFYLVDSSDTPVVTDGRVIDGPIFCPDLEGIGLPVGTSAMFVAAPMRIDRRTPVTAFEPTDPINSELWSGDDYIVLSRPFVSWIEESFPKFRVRFFDSNTTGLKPGDYRFRVTVTVDGNTHVISDDTISLGTSPGSVEIPHTYCTFDMMLNLYSGLTELQKEQSDESGFISIRKLAKDVLDYNIWNRYWPTPNKSKRLVSIADPTYGFYVPDLSTNPPSRNLIRSSLEENRLVLDGAQATVFAEIAARLSIAYVLDRQEVIRPNSGYAGKAIEFREKAFKKLACFDAYIDTNGDGNADVTVNKDVTFL